MSDVVGEVSAADVPLTRIRCPLAVESIAAGFPSPAEGLVERRLDLNETFIRNPAATFFVRVAGDSMIGAGIFRGDLLVVDRALDARDGHIVVARLGGEYTLKRLRQKRGSIYLVAENPDYAPLNVTDAPDFEVWGVVVCVIRALPPCRI